MRFPLALTRWITFLLLIHCLVLPQAFSQHSTPIKKKGLTDALGTGGLSVAELTKIIEERGVDFRLTYDNEDDLRKAGATDPILDAVSKHYRHALAPQADRTKAATLVKSSKALFDAHDANSAMPVVNQALELDPDSADAYVLRARLYFTGGDAKRGQADANIALQIAPTNAEARRLLQNGGGSEATATPNTGGTEIPSAGHGGFLGFRLLQKNGQYVVVGTLPSGSAARGGLLVGDVALSANGISFKDFYEQYLTQGKLAAGQTVNMQIQRQGQSLALQLVALARPNAGDESLRYFGQLIQQFPGNPEAYYYRATIYGQLKNYAAALADSNTFVRLNPGDVAGYEQRAAIKAAMGDQQGAKADKDAAASMLAAENGGNAGGKTQANNTPQNNVPQNNAPANNNNGATASYAAIWTLLEFNQSYKLTQLEDHFYFQGLNVNSTGEAGKTTDKKGNVVYKGKWRQQNANGTVNVWNFVLKKVTSQRIEGTVMTLGFTGQTVTFVPLR